MQGDSIIIQTRNRARKYFSASRSGRKMMGKSSPICILSSLSAFTLSRGDDHGLYHRHRRRGYENDGRLSRPKRAGDGERDERAGQLSEGGAAGGPALFLRGHSRRAV